MRFVRSLLDLVVVVVFVVIGRHTHDHGVNLSGVASTMWPFVVGLVVGWGWVALRHGTGATLREGAQIAVTTVVFGMVLRVFVGQGTVPAFIAVACVFLGGAMLGWRLVARRGRRT